MSITRVSESIVVGASLEVVWEKVRNADFSFWSIVKSVELNDGASVVGGFRNITFNDGTTQKARIVEISLLEHSISFEIVESDPPVKYMSALHTIKLRHVTQDNTTFVEWTTEFSSDAGQDVIQDSRFKRKDGLRDLAKSF